MAKITSYPSGTLNLNDYLIGTDRENENVTRSYKVSEVINTIIAAAPGSIGTVTSISTVSSSYINVTGGPITVTGTVGANISATGTTNNTTFLRGDDTWSLPGPTPNSVSILSNGTVVAANVNSIDFINGITATAANLSITAYVPGQAVLVDSVIAGTAISVSGPTGAVTITNTGVTLARAGGNITLSGGTGNVTISTTANAGAISGVNSGLGIATITYSTTNPEIDIEFTGVNNYISRSLAATVVLPGDLVEFNELTVSNVKNVEIGDITPSLLTAVKTYIDDADENKVKNATDTYTSTEKALNMVSLTDAQYTALVNAGTVNENTLYFVIGASVSYTVNPIVTDNITGDAGYTISTTPSSVSGVAGTPYTFTTTVNVQPGGSFTGTNPVVTTDTINSVSGNPYNKAITVTGVYTAPLADSVRASLVILLDQTASGSVAGSNLTTNSGNLTFSGNTAGDKDPLAYSTANPTFYGFTSAVAITDTNTYEFTTGPTVINASGSLIPSSVGQDVTVYSYMHGTVALKTYTVDLVVVNSITVTGTGAGVPTYTMDFESTGSQVQQSSITQAGGTISSAITGLNNTNTFGFGLNNLNWALVDTDYTWSVAPTVVISANTSPIAGANGSATATVSGTILYTEPVTGESRQLNATAVMNAAMVGSTLQLYTLNNDVSPVVTGQTPANYHYTVPTIVPNTGYYLTGGVVALVTNPVFYNVTGYQSGGGTPANPYIEVNPTVSPGNIYISTATVTVNCTATARTATITYITTFISTITTTGINLTTNSPSSTDTSAFFYTGDGNATVSVSRTSPSNTSQGPGTIVWSLNGVQAFSESFTSLTAINYTKVIPGVAHGDTILVTISELGQFRQLIATTPMNTAMGAATQYTLSNNVQSISTSGNNDTTKTYTTPTIIPDVGYELTGGVVSLSSIGSNGTVTYFTSVWGTAGASNNGSGETLGDPAIENAVSVTTGTLATETRKLDPAAYIATQITGTAYTLTNGASQTINSAGLTTYNYLIPVVVPDTGYTLTGGLVSLPYNPITFFVTGGQGGTGTALDPIIENDPTVTAGTLATTKATVEVNCVAVPATTAITYVTTFAPGGGFPTRTLTTTGTQFLQNTAYAIGDGNITIQVTRTAPSGTAQDGGSIIWILNGVTQSTQTFSNGATISYSRSLVAAEGDTIKVEISEG